MEQSKNYAFRHILSGFPKTHKKHKTKPMTLLNLILILNLRLLSHRCHLYHSEHQISILEKSTNIHVFSQYPVFYINGNLMLNMQFISSFLKLYLCNDIHKARGVCIFILKNALKWPWWDITFLPFLLFL